MTLLEYRNAGYGYEQNKILDGIIFMLDEMPSNPCYPHDNESRNQAKAVFVNFVRESGYKFKSEADVEAQSFLSQPIAKIYNQAMAESTNCSVSPFTPSTPSGYTTVLKMLQYAKGDIQDRLLIVLGMNEMLMEFASSCSTTKGSNNQLLNK